MKNVYTIKITGVVASSGREYNRISFDVTAKDGKAKNMTVVYPNDEDSLAVDNTVFELASNIFFSGSDQQALAQLYINRCCCCSDTMIAVDGIKRLMTP